jgi:hypothetical protein
MNLEAGVSDLEGTGEKNVGKLEALKNSRMPRAILYCLD